MAIPFSYNFRNLLVRRISTLTAAVGVALVVMVFIMVLALRQGFLHTVKTTGSPQNVIVLRKGANAEVQSGILREEAQTMAVRPEIARGSSGRPLFVAEMIVLVVLPRKGDGAPANVVVRGTSPEALDLRSVVRITEGTMFRQGLAEIMVGRALSKRMKDMGLGDTLTFRKRQWKVVGIFEAEGTGFESEIWGDASILQAAFQREEGYQSLTFRMQDPAGFPPLKAELESDPKFQLELKTEDDYYSRQGDGMAGMISILGGMVTIIMSVGAVVGAMNTMYAAVGSRAREVATMRALGFGRFAILLSFQAESLILSAMGGVLGMLISLPIHGMTTGTTNWDTFSELSFAFRLTPEILLGGFAFALIMGVLGGLLPSFRAARLPIVTGLRQN
jgi:ABC-type antimicrobial peptide transport system permease subunit